MLLCLCFKTAQDIFYFLFANRVAQWHKKIGHPQITVILRDFVFQNEMISKRIPSQIRNDLMILMQVVPIMGKNKIGRAFLFDLLKELLDLISHKWEEAHLKILHHDRFFLGLL